MLQASLKSIPFSTLRPEGNVLRVEHPNQVPENFVEFCVLSWGNEVKDAQLFQQFVKSIPLIVFKIGKDLRAEQPIHVELKLVPTETFNSGNPTKPLQSFQASLKSSPTAVSIKGKGFKVLQLLHV